MNWSFLFGGIIVAASVWTIFDKALGMTVPLWNPWAALLVFTASFGLALISMGWKRTWESLTYLFSGMQKANPWKDQEVVEKLTALAQAYRDYDFKKWDNIYVDDFTQSCKSVIKEGVVDLEARKNIFYTKQKVLQENGTRQALQLKHLGQYPIGVGLLSLVISCFALSWSLMSGGQQDTVVNILSFGFHSVLYGFFVSHLWMYPLARRLYEQTNDSHFYHQMIAHGMNLIGLRTNPVLVAEEMVAFVNQHPANPHDKKKVEETLVNDEVAS
jgi:flagellar motor component MotA